jgi:hypothetical protein
MGRSRLVSARQDGHSRCPTLGINERFLCDDGRVPSGPEIRSSDGTVREGEALGPTDHSTRGVSGDDV